MHIITFYCWGCLSASRENLHIWKNTINYYRFSSTINTITITTTAATTTTTTTTATTITAIATIIGISLRNSCCILVVTVIVAVIIVCSFVIFVCILLSEAFNRGKVTVVSLMFVSRSSNGSSSMSNVIKD
ncbi:hypothetical protein GQX74_004833 [Glossina fuscipes]|nr:hypothetical protein GQX74_004833 [Glossina fuscipes]